MKRLTSSCPSPGGEGEKRAGGGKRVRVTGYGEAVKNFPAVSLLIAQIPGNSSTLNCDFGNSNHAIRCLSDFNETFLVKNIQYIVNWSVRLNHLSSNGAIIIQIFIYDSNKDLTNKIVGKSWNGYGRILFKPISCNIKEI